MKSENLRRYIEEQTKKELEAKKAEEGYKEEEKSPYAKVGPPRNRLLL